MVPDIFYILILSGEILLTPGSFYFVMNTGQNDMNVSKRIVLIHLGGGIGDLLLSTALLQPLKEQFKDACVTMVIRREIKDLLQDHPMIDEVLPIESHALKSWSNFNTLIGALRDRRFDIGIVLWSTAPVAWLLYLSGVPVRVGQGSRLFYSFLYTHRVRVRSEYGDTTSHWVDCLLDYVRALGCEVSLPPPSSIIIRPGPQHHARADELLTAAGYSRGGLLIGFSVGKGISLNEEKWPVEYFARCADELARAFGATIVMTGDGREVELVRAVVSKMESNPVNAAGKTSLLELAALTGRCSVFVCPDSAPMHIAAAMKVPTVGIFAQKSDFPQRWRPYALNYEVLVPQKNTCLLKCIKEKCPRFSCYEEIPPRLLIQAVSRLLSKDPIL